MIVTRASAGPTRWPVAAYIRHSETTRGGSAAAGGGAKNSRRTRSPTTTTHREVTTMAASRMRSRDVTIRVREEGWKPRAQPPARLPLRDQSTGGGHEAPKQAQWHSIQTPLRLQEHLVQPGRSSQFESGHTSACCAAAYFGGEARRSSPARRTLDDSRSALNRSGRSRPVRLRRKVPWKRRTSEAGRSGGAAERLHDVIPGCGPQPVCRLRRRGGCNRAAVRSERRPSVPSGRRRSTGV